MPAARKAAARKATPSPSPSERKAAASGAVDVVAAEAGLTPAAVAAALELLETSPTGYVLRQRLNDALVGALVRRGYANKVPGRVSLTAPGRALYEAVR